MRASGGVRRCQLQVPAAHPHAHARAAPHRPARAALRRCARDALRGLLFNFSTCCSTLAPRSRLLLDLLLTPLLLLSLISLLHILLYILFLFLLLEI